MSVLLCVHKDSNCHFTYGSKLEVTEIFTHTKTNWHFQAGKFYPAW
jgi:hypothetical protein